jgi:hypothetical protein
MVTSPLGHALVTIQGTFCCRKGDELLLAPDTFLGRTADRLVVLRSDLRHGDVIRIRTAHGGGFGDPRRRPREDVLDDVRNGYVSWAEARGVYGCTQ